MDDKFPYLGADVWFVAGPQQVFAAKIVQIKHGAAPDGQTFEACRLRVDLPDGVLRQDSIQDELGKLPGTWHWPRPSRIQVATGISGSARI